MEKLIYTDNLPQFEKYEIIETNIEEWHSINKAVQKDNISGIYNVDYLYIKGFNRLEVEDNTIPVEQFFKDYLKLGKKLFDLSTPKHTIRFIIEQDITNSPDLKSHYIEMYYHDIVENLTDTEKDLVKEFEKMEELIIKLEDTYNKKEENIFFIENLMDEKKDLVKEVKKIEEFSTKTRKIYDTFKENISLIKQLTSECFWNALILIDIKEQSIYMKLWELLEFSFVLDEYNYKISNLYSKDLKKLNNIDNTLLEYYNKLVIFKEQSSRLLSECNFEKKLKKKLSRGIRSLEKITNTKFYNYKDELPITINFGINQMKNVKNILMTWLKKYGFPYYVSEENEEEYHKQTKKILSLNDNEELIPCRDIVYNSIFNYMYYTLYIDWNNTDKKILDIFKITSKDLAKGNKLDNRKHIVSQKKILTDYNKFVCTSILNFKSDSKIEDIDILPDKSDNNFTYSKNEFTQEEIFNNMCVAMNKLVYNKTYNYKTTGKIQYCQICNKELKPHERKYCSNPKCKRKGKQETDKLNKRKNRAKKS